MTHELRYWIAKCVALECRRVDSIDEEAVLDRLWNQAHATVNPPPVLSELDRREILRMARD